MKKKIKINYWGIADILWNRSMLMDILTERYDVEISDEPDYVFCCSLNGYGYCKYDGVRIFLGLECFFPDMNLFDYALTMVDMGETERHHRMFPVAFFPYWQKGYGGDENCLKDEKKFCNYIYSHPGCRERVEIYDVISSYKHVDSAGRWLNNMDGFTPGPMGDWDEKIRFQHQYKFSIGVENFSYPYYVGDKLVDPFLANSIPIYYGDPHVGEYANEKAFVNLHAHNSFEDALKKIIEIDQNDDLFYEMINAPKFNDSRFIEKEVQGIKDFIYHIFDQDYKDAFRRPDFFWPKKHELQLQIAEFSYGRALDGSRFAEMWYKKSIEKIAIYGQGEIYQVLKNEMLNSNVTIQCIIETYKPSIEKNADGIDVVWVNEIEKYNEVDVIVVTISYLLEEVECILERVGCDKKVISIADCLK